jgi:hypothetical protein
MGRFRYLNRPTVVLPGTHGTVSGTAINDWLDENGQSKFATQDSQRSEDSPAAGR